MLTTEEGLREVLALTRGQLAAARARIEDLEGEVHAQHEQLCEVRHRAEREAQDAETEAEAVLGEAQSRIEEESNKLREADELWSLWAQRALRAVSLTGTLPAELEALPQAERDEEMRVLIRAAVVKGAADEARLHAVETRQAEAAAKDKRGLPTPKDVGVAAAERAEAKVRRKMARGECTMRLVGGAEMILRIDDLAREGGWLVRWEEVRRPDLYRATFFASGEEGA